MPENIWPIIGVDESGKGDFFGPLVIAGAFVEENQLPRLAEIGVRDSKKIADNRILVIAAQIKKICVYDVVVISPDRYNQLYRKIKNLNKLLGWGHAKVIENVLTKKPAPAAISDKFGKDHFIIDNLQKLGREINLMQKVRGESHPAVAAASILARAEFIYRMKSMSDAFGMTFPKGAAAQVDNAGRNFVGIKGEPELEKVAKLHFKNYQKIMS
ncbi:MAG: ribonuclease HIII [candidate division Zixibacteria bacterium]|nr:ribonuclease HIII [candidate division Zixibacteria bacterium]